MLTNTTVPSTAMSAAFRSVKNNSNRALPTEYAVATLRQTANPGRVVTFESSSVESDCNSHYVDMCKNLPTSSYSTPELEWNIHQLQHMHEVSVIKLEDFTQPTDLFTHPDKVKSTELYNNETTPAENYQDNGVYPLIITQ